MRARASAPNLISLAAMFGKLLVYGVNVYPGE
jgi:hypothetical protein